MNLFYIAMVIDKNVQYNDSFRNIFFENSMYYVVDKVTFNFQIYFFSLQLFYTAKVSSVKIINQYVHASNKVIFEIILQAL